MKRHIVIDGYNLIYQFPDLRRLLERDLESARNALVARLANYAEENQVDTLVVFDGDENVDEILPPRKWLKIVYSRFPEKADPIILRMIRAKKNKEELLVVSSDQEIKNCARLYGAKIISSQSYANDLTPKSIREAEKKFDHPLSDGEIDEWMDLFQKGSGPKDT